MKLVFVRVSECEAASSTMPVIVVCFYSCTCFMLMCAMTDKPRVLVIILRFNLCKIIERRLK